jgi:hypothetical protein
MTIILPFPRKGYMYFCTSFLTVLGYNQLHRPKVDWNDVFSHKKETFLDLFQIQLGKHKKKLPRAA